MYVYDCACTCIRCMYMYSSGRSATECVTIDFSELRLQLGLCWELQTGAVLSLLFLVCELIEVFNERVVFSFQSTPEPAAAVSTSKTSGDISVADDKHSPLPPQSTLCPRANNPSLPPTVSR